MAKLIPCPKCGTPVSPDARMCPACGEPVGAKRAQRGCLYMLLAIVIIVFAAIGLPILMS